MHVLDTDMLTLLHAGDPRVQERKDRFDPSEVVATVITRIEILRGRFDYVLKAADGNAKLTCRGGWKARKPREAVMPPRSGAAPRSAGPPAPPPRVRSGGGGLSSPTARSSRPCG
jgi:hypothetical protein